MGRHGGNMVQVLEQARKLEERLRRLDEVLPRYQQLASRLMDLLCVQSLDQILPSIQTLLKNNANAFSPKTTSILTLR